MKIPSEYCYRQVRDKSQSQCNCSSLISICRDFFLCCTCWKKHISISVLRCVKLCHCWNEALDFDTVRSKDGPCTWRMFLFQFNLFTSHCTESWVLNGLFALVTTCKSDIKKVTWLIWLWDPQYRYICFVTTHMNDFLNFYLIFYINYV